LETSSSNNIYDLIKLSNDDTGGLIFMMNRGNINVLSIQLDKCLNENEWNHIVINRNNTNGKWTLQCNDKTSAAKVAHTFYEVSRPNVYIGKTLKGNIADLRFYKMPITADQRKAIKNDFLS